MASELSRSYFLLGVVIILHCCGKVACSHSCSYSNIRSPGYPGKYPENLDCTWTKSSSLDIVRLDISSLDLEQCSRCTCDYVEVFDGDSKSSKSLGKYCTGSVYLVSTGRYLTVAFHTDHTKGQRANTGFQANSYSISRSDVCKKDSYTISTAYSNYGNVDCSWTLTTHYTGYVVVLDVSSLSFGTCSSSCSCGQLEVYNTLHGIQTKIGSWCSRPQKSIISRGRNMLVKFVSTPKSTTQSFRAEYKFVREIGVCKQADTLEANEYSQTLKSYNQPSPYIRLVDCAWTIKGRDGQLIRLTVSELDLGGCISCGFLQIYDGETELVGKNLGKWRSSKPDIVSTGKYMKVKFKTSKFDTNKGLIATYRTVPKNNVCAIPNGDSGTIESMNYPFSYPGNINCFWKLHAPGSYLVRFYTVGMNISTINCKSSCKSLAVYDGPSIIDSKLGTYENEDVSLVSSTSQLSLVFKTYQGGSGGFRGKYQFVHKSEVCKDSLNLQANAFGGAINSRNFPEHYWGNMHCFWRIQAGPDHKIRLIVQTIDFEDLSHFDGSSQCRDYIDIFDGANRNSKSLGRWCKTRADLVSSGTYLYIEMHTSARVSHRGFKAKYFAIHTNNVCPGSGVLIAESGTIKSPSFPQHYYGGISCDWTITVSFGKRIRIKSRSLNLEQCHPCGSDCDHIEISDVDFSSGRRIVGKWCIESFDVISRGNTVNIRFKSNLNNAGESFVIEYKSVQEEEVCPINQISHSSGTVTSMGYPNDNYPGNLKCQYQMKAPYDNQVIRLEFTYFQLAACGFNSGSCKFCGDTLQAVEWIKIANRIKMANFSRWCSTWNNPHSTHIFSSGKNLFLNFDTDATSQDTGFRATYRSVSKNLGCLHTGTLSKNSGNFSGPRSPFNSETLCTWFIKVASEKKIELKFKYTSVTQRDCSFAYVKVYDGFSPTSSSFGRFCEHYWWKKIKSTGPSLYVTLWVDSTSRSHGVPYFYAEYIAVDNAGKPEKCENLIIGIILFWSMLLPMF
ncbi:dorsal-ventral patterning tolloid-like protein 1 [Dendronephthya gigantea]|uniref:dorsal-ventral patterning tolloid-like protein 1 n=1 Tax=Dendronephthya gigantea TaxID=151771 RepID=UPI00106CB473|nr:dorsal-ventral patterning tolloid-like protein 1 [Dendronephthya gigantea]